MSKAPSPYDDNPCKPRHFKPPPCAPVALDEPTKQVLETGRSRLLVTAALFTLAFAVIGVRLIDVTLIKPAVDPKAAAQAPRALQPPSTEMARADIVDRNGVLIATTLASPSLFANPKQISDPADAAKKLVAVLPDLSEAEVTAKLAASEKSFVWLKRHLTPKQQFEINRLGIPGFQFEREERRVYPDGNLAAHVVGYSGIDNKGLAGIERGMDEVLKESREPLRLSLDIRVQHIMHEELTRAVEEFSAIGGTGIMLDVRNGEVISMVSLPDFDPNRPGTATPERIFNRATLGAYEMGSIFKIFNTAMVIDNRVGNLNSSYDATRSIHIGRFTIEDYHAKRRWLTMAEIFMYSSNIGSVKMALEAGTERQKDFFQRLGMTKTPSIEIPEVAAPLVPSPWREVNTMTISFGHGMSVTPLHMATGVSAMVNGGMLRQSTILKRPDNYVPSGQQVVSPRTSEDIRRLMRLVVEQGTGTMAAAPGYVVGGKTGTAEKVSGKGYARKALLSSFIAAFPMQDPRYLVLVMVDEPHGTKKTFGYATGGWVAAPVISRVVTRAAPLLGVKPVDENTPEIKSVLRIDQPQLQVKKLASN
jgi:cell division protein FtsI (penicillin-binding protein 3)